MKKEQLISFLKRTKTDNAYHKYRVCEVLDAARLYLEDEGRIDDMKKMTEEAMQTGSYAESLDAIRKYIL